MTEWAEVVGWEGTPGAIRLCEGHKPADPSPTYTKGTYRD